jgi:hypothetical protein
MATQNMVSASLTPEAKAEILQKLGEVRGKLGFLLSLAPDEVQSLLKVGKGYAPFLDKAYNAAAAHPEILSGAFDLGEFKSDYALAKDLSAIASQARELADGLENTLTAVNSDAMTAALDVYASIKLNKDKVAGLQGVCDDMGAFFKKARKASSSAKA